MNTIKLTIHILLLCSLPFIFCLISCQNTEYEQMLKREQARGIRVDSLFLGLKFGDSKKEFFDKCRKMNLQGITEDGSGVGLNVQVLHRVDSTLTDDNVNMYFYPNFDEKYNIIEMPVYYTYKAYFPYVQRFKSTALMPQVIKLMENQYGKFLTIAKEGKDTLYVRVDGNRRILISKKDDQFVSVKFTDLTATQKK